MSQRCTCCYLHISGSLKVFYSIASCEPAVVNLSCLFSSSKSDDCMNPKIPLSSAQWKEERVGFSPHHLDDVVANRFSFIHDICNKIFRPEGNYHKTTDVCFVLRWSLTKMSRMTLNLLSSPSWPQTWQSSCLSLQGDQDCMCHQICQNPCCQCFFPKHPQSPCNSLTLRPSAALRRLSAGCAQDSHLCCFTALYWLNYFYQHNSSKGRAREVLKKHCFKWVGVTQNDHHSPPFLVHGWFFLSETTDIHLATPCNDVIPLLSSVRLWSNICTSAPCLQDPILTMSTVDSAWCKDTAQAPSRPCCC